MKKLTCLAVAAALGLSAASVQAYEAGDIIVRAGAATVAPDVDSGRIALNGVKGNSTVDVDKNTQLGLSMTYMFKDNLGLELLAATPFSHTVEVDKGSLAPTFGNLADVKHLPPTLTVQYYPMDANSMFQPYVGAGINYTLFFDANLKGAGKAGFRDLKFKNSVGLAFQVGFDYEITKNIGVNAAMWWMDIDTTATMKSKDGATKVKVKAELDPLVYMVGLNYRF